LQILKGKGGEKKTDWSTIFNKKEHREGRRPASRRVGRNKYIAKKNPYFFVEKKSINKKIEWLYNSIKNKL
jgi:hypothetical protein